MKRKVQKYFSLKKSIFGNLIAIGRTFFCPLHINAGGGGALGHVPKKVEFFLRPPLVDATFKNPFSYYGVLHVSETGLFNMGGDDDVMLGRAGQGVDLVQSHAVTLFHREKSSV